MTLVLEKLEPTSLRIMTLSDKMIIPTKGSQFVPVMTSIAVSNGVVLAKRQAMVETGIAIGLPEETYGRLAARTGMAIRLGIAVGSGVIDTDYTGEVKVILGDPGQAEYSFSAGDQMAQLIVQQIADGSR